MSRTAFICHCRCIWCTHHWAPPPVDKVIRTCVGCGAETQLEPAYPSFEWVRQPMPEPKRQEKMPFRWWGVKRFQE